jgi:hypothetical protein
MNLVTKLYKKNLENKKLVAKKISLKSSNYLINR